MKSADTGKITRKNNKNAVVKAGAYRIVTTTTTIIEKLNFENSV
jgi:hypothetical protein